MPLKAVLAAIIITILKYHFLIIGCHIEKAVFIQYYANLVNILPVTNILHSLVSEGIISTEDSEEISCVSRPKEKASFILNKIKRFLDAGAKNNFNALLDIMEECDNVDVQDIVIDMRRTLMTGESTTYICACKHIYYIIHGSKYTILRQIMAGLV